MNSHYLQGLTLSTSSLVSLKSHETLKACLRQDLSHFSLFRSNQRNRSLSYEDCYTTQSDGSPDEDPLEVILSIVRLQFPVLEKFTLLDLTSDPDTK